jgi:hypothetical protein
MRTKLKKKSSAKCKKKAAKKIKRRRVKKVKLPVMATIDVPQVALSLEKMVAVDNLEKTNPVCQEPEVQEINFEKEYGCVALDEVDEEMDFHSYMIAEIAKTSKKLGLAQDFDNELLMQKYEEEYDRNKKILKIWHILQGNSNDTGPNAA